MSEVVIIIPTRLAATRLPNKPLLKIDGKEMILHVFERANQVKNAKTIIATPDKEIHELIQAKGGLSYLTEKNHETGTDRVFEVYEKMFKFVPEIIINLQGDMPNIVTSDIENLINYYENDDDNHNNYLDNQFSAKSPSETKKNTITLLMTLIKR